ncbi:MAG: lipid A biosynthesis acyltransferase [Flavobacterium sp. BFFFF2]|nr:MAG: lipid A biosynthesis acyltransferase [Flavobacterium sp. BFFFF2]
MALLIYCVFYPLIWLLSRLPFPLLYILSDGISFFLYHVVRYRRRVVHHNILICFPHKTNRERACIERAFYHHLSDLFLEMIKTMGMSNQEMEKRFQFTNLDLLYQLEKEGKSIAILCAHYGSYEWLISMNRHVHFQGFAIYKKIANPYFDTMVKRIRSKFGATLITTKETTKTIEANTQNGVLGMYGFASDQSPKLSRAEHWHSFMGIETPIHIGAEVLAKRFDMNVIFLKVKKVKRGHYKATFESLSDNPKAEPDFAISDRFMDKVALQIQEAPEYYFWVHKRWKHQKSATT